MIKKRLILLSILLVLCVGLIVTYFAFENRAKETEDEEPISLLPGEAVEGKYLLIFEHLERASISRMEISNPSSHYVFSYDDATSDFVLEGYDTAPYDQYKFSALIVDAGMPLARRVCEHCDDLSVYGLDEESITAWYSLTTFSGTVHTVKIGNAVPDKSGYYCRYEGRDAVYVLTSTLESTILASLPSLISPIIAYPVSTNDYYTVDRFVMTRNGQQLVAIDYLPEEERTSTDCWEMVSPSGYIVHDTNYSKLLQIFASPYGTETLMISENGEQIPEETLAKLGLDSAHAYVTVSFNYGGMTNVMRFTEPNEAGLTMCYAEMFRIVVACKTETFNFLNWNLIDFVSKVPLSLSIDKVASVRFEAEGLDETFLLSGIGSGLQIQRKADNRVYLKESDVTNFRQLYKDLLIVYIQDYTESTDTSDLILTYTLTLRDGTEMVYRYYGYSTRRCYYTVNGEGEFCVLRDSVNKVISDVGRFLSGEEIDSWSKN